MGQCLKCGKQASERNAFCDTCLEDMQKYPVKPGTAFQILQRPVRKAAPRETPPAEQIAQLRSTKNRLIAMLVTVTALLLVMALLLLYNLDNSTRPTIPIGRNYTSTASHQP